MPKKNAQVKSNSTFIYDLAFGKVGEKWVKELLGGDFKVEVKTDRKAARTGNVFIEIMYRGRPSGISTTGADYWVYRIHERDTALVIPVKNIREMTARYVSDGKMIHAGEHSQGVLIPIIDIILLKNVTSK